MNEKMICDAFKEMKGFERHPKVGVKKTRLQDHTFWQRHFFEIYQPGNTKLPNDIIKDWGTLYIWSNIVEHYAIGLRSEQLREAIWHRLENKKNEQQLPADRPSVLIVDLTSGDLSADINALEPFIAYELPTILAADDKKFF
jgi:hypothetical protein